MRESPVTQESLLRNVSEDVGPLHGGGAELDPAPDDSADASRSRTIDRDSLLLDGVEGDDEQLTRRASQSSRLRRTPVWGAAVNTIAFMCVPRTVPACFAATGWTLGVASLLYSSAVTYDTGLLLGVVCNELHASAAVSFPSLAAEAAGRVAARYGRDTRVQARWRWLGSLVVGALQHTCYYLTGVAELIYFEQVSHALPGLAWPCFA